MIDLPPLRPFTVLKTFDDLMKICLNRGIEIDIDGIKNSYGEEIKRSTISQSVSKLTAERFPGKRFYVRTHPETKRLVLGCHTPDDEKEQ